MDTYQQFNPGFWNTDISFPASDFDHLPEDEFLSLLEKEFPDSAHFIPVQGATFDDAVNPKNITTPTVYTASSLSPPSDDSSPSPPHQDAIINPLRTSPPDHEDHDSALKRKATDEQAQDGPSSKTQHTVESPSKKTPPKKKSSGGAPQDEGRLLKRKEQNRAAQRAFRERKERHVKDLEDKVAALRAEADQAQSENENLRDLLQRLQEENVVLKQPAFAVELGPATAPSDPIRMTEPPAPIPVSAPLETAIDWSSLHTLDPNVMDILDGLPQQATATDGAMQMNFGFGDMGAFTTIANNPLSMSFAETFETSDKGTSSTLVDDGSFDFDVQDIAAWPTVSSPDSLVPLQSSLDDLFGSSYFGSLNQHDFSDFMSRTPSSEISNRIAQSSSSTSLSPVVHAAIPPVASGSSPATNPSPSLTSVSSPLPNHTPSLTSGSSPLPNHTPFSVPREASTPPSSDESHGTGCPKTREEIARKIAEAGPSPFVEQAAAAHPIKKIVDPKLGPIVTCGGATFPSTTQSEKNVDVIAAWKRIVADPNFQDADINELCTEFSSKAKCDGEKLVIDPQGVSQLLETFTKKGKSKSN